MKKLESQSKVLPLTGGRVAQITYLVHVNIDQKDLDKYYSLFHTKNPKELEEVNKIAEKQVSMKAVIERIKIMNFESQEPNSFDLILGADLELLNTAITGIHSGYVNYTAPIIDILGVPEE